MTGMTCTEAEPGTSCPWLSGATVLLLMTRHHPGVGVRADTPFHQAAAHRYDATVMRDRQRQVSATTRAQDWMRLGAGVTRRALVTVLERYAILWFVMKESSCTTFCLG